MQRGGGAARGAVLHVRRAGGGHADRHRVQPHLRAVAAAAHHLRCEARGHRSCPLCSSSLRCSPLQRPSPSPAQHQPRSTAWLSTSPSCRVCRVCICLDTAAGLEPSYHAYQMARSAKAGGQESACCAHTCCAGDVFSGAEILDVPPNGKGTYTVTYRPVSMTAQGQPHEGSLFIGEVPPRPAHSAAQSDLAQTPSTASGLGGGAKSRSGTQSRVCARRDASAVPEPSYRASRMSFCGAPDTCTPRRRPTQHDDDTRAPGWRNAFAQAFRTGRGCCTSCRARRRRPRPRAASSAPSRPSSSTASRSPCATGCPGRSASRCVGPRHAFSLAPRGTNARASGKEDSAQLRLG